MQLGLSKHQRHVQLVSCFGQFQLSKVRFNQDLAAKLTYNPPASELHRLLPKLKMHIKTAAEARALSTVLCENEAFLGRPSSFYIGVVNLTPIMAELGLEQLEQTVSRQLTLTAYARKLDQDQLERINLDKLESDQLQIIDLDKLERTAVEKLQPTYVSQLWGRELVKPNPIPELQSLQRKELAEMTTKTLDKLELDKSDSSLELSAYNGTALRMIDKIKDKLSASQCIALLQQPDEGRRAFALGDAASRSESEQLQLLNREIVFNLAFSEQEDQLSLSGGASEALALFSKSSSARPTKRTSISLSSTLLFIFFILMISIFPSKSLENSFDNNFIHCCAFQLVEQDELSTTFGQKELGKKNEFHTTFLWDQELEELLVDKPFPLDPLHGHLGKENLWSVQLQQNLLENDEQKELEDPELEEKNFDKSFQKKIFLKKLDALLLEWHFAKAASHQLVGIKAGEKHREASKEIGLNKKKGDKELPPKLRRQELGCTDLWPAYFRALCPPSFEENSFNEETFSNTSLGEQTFRQNSFTRSSLTRSSLTRHSLTTSSFTERSLTQSSLTENSFSENTFLKNSFSEDSFDKKSLAEKSFDKKSLDKSSFGKSSFDKSSLEESSLAQSSFSNKSLDKSSFGKSSFEDSSFEKSSLPNSSLKGSSFDKKSFDKKSFDKKSLDKKGFDQSSFTQSSLTESSFTQSSLTSSSLPEGSLTSSSLTRSSFPENTFAKHSFKACSFNKGSFEESSFATSSFPKQSFTKSSLEQSSLQTNSFDASLEASSFQGASLARAASTRTAWTLQLAKLERRTSRLELGQLEQPALLTELAQLSAQLCTTLEEPSISLGGPSFLTSWAQGGVLRVEKLVSTTVTLLSLGHALCWLKPDLELSPEKEASLSKLSKVAKSRDKNNLATKAFL